MSKKRENNFCLAAVFGKRLAKLRKERQMSQTELGEAIGMSRSAIAYYESWARNPTLDAVEKVAEFFEVSPSYLLIEDEQKDIKKPKTKLDQQIQKLKSLTPHKQKGVLKVLEAAMGV